MKEFYVDVRFRVKAEDRFEAARKVHDFIPDVDGDIIEWVMADSLIVPCHKSTQEAKENG